MKLISVLFSVAFAFSASAQTWTGAVNSDWNNAQNWSATPNNGANITINGLNLTGAAQMPVISSNSTFSPGTVTMSNGAILAINANLSTSDNFFVNDAGSQLIINAGTLSVNFADDGRLIADFGGSIIVNSGIVNVGERFIAGAGATVTFNGGVSTTNERLLIDGDSQMILNAGTVNVGETFALADGGITGDAYFEQNGGIINITGEAAMECEAGIYQPTIAIKGGVFNLTGDLVWFGAAPGAGMPRLEVKAGVMNISGSVSNLAGSTVSMYFLADSVGVVNMGTLLDMPFANDSLVQMGSSQIRFDSNASINNAGTILGTGGTLEIVAATTTLNGTGFCQWHNINISGTNATLSQFTPIMHVHGNFTKTGNFTANITRTIFNGMLPQTLSGQNQALFYELEMNGLGGLTLNIPAQVNNHLELTNGKINTNTASVLNLTPLATSSLGNAQSFVNGPMTKTGFTSFVFPIGKNNTLGRFAIGGSSQMTNVYRAEYFDASFAQISPTNAPLQAVSIAEYWTLQQTAGNNPVQVTLHWQDAQASLINDCADIGLASWNGSSWNYVLSTTSGGCTGNDSGALQSVNTVNSSGTFTIGFTSGITTQSFTICESESVLVGNNVYEMAGIYFDTLVDANAQDSIVITNLTVNPITYETQSITICESESFTVGNNVYVEAGTYTDTLFNAQGCFHVLTTELTLNPITYETQEINICNGETYAIGNNVYNESGTYTDTLNNEFGCFHVLTTELSVYVVNEELNYLDGTIYSLNTNATSYQWFDCVHNQEISGATASSYTPIDNGLYAVILVDNNCIDTTFCLAIFDVGVSENQMSNFELYPNPADQVINMNSISGSVFSFEIKDVQGRTVLKHDAQNAYHTIDISDFTPAYYFVRLFAADGSVIVKPFIKK
jgi:hypothetical protein